MSLENKIEVLTAEVVKLTAALVALNIPQMSASAPVAPAAPAPFTPAPVAPAPAVQMPPPPSFMAPVAPAAPAVPFNDGKGLIAYVMESYKVLGPEKGVGIQNVLTGLGYGKINEVKPEHYAALVAGIESLKGA